jgi:replicative DNA helicase
MNNSELNVTGTSSNSLTFRHISDAVNKSLDYIDGRRTGKYKSLKTGFKKLDRALLNGIEWNKIFSIGAMSGSGKSVFLEQLKRNILKLNKQKMKILSFEFEMPSYEQITRNLSGELGMSTSELYSGERPITDDEFDNIKQTSMKFAKQPIYTVDSVGTVEQVINTITSFVMYHKIHETKEGLIITLDHALLTSMKQGEDERKMLAHLYRSIVALKKRFDVANIPCLFLILNQLNRNIEKIERKDNPDYHYPNRNDLFGSNDIFMGSDYVLIIHKPAILNFRSYGPPLETWPKGLPVYSPSNPDQAMIYFHLIKQRSGNPRMMMMLDNFKNSKIDEY